MPEQQLQLVDRGAQAVIKKLHGLEVRFQKLSEQRELLKEQLREVMARNDIKKIDTDDFTITYVDETVTHRFDSARFKKDHPETYELYQSPSVVKAHVRFKLK